VEVAARGVHGGLLVEGEGAVADDLLLVACGIARSCADPAARRASRAAFRPRGGRDRVGSATGRPRGCSGEGGIPGRPAAATPTASRTAGDKQEVVGYGAFAFYEKTP